jgi:hypothetical protein
MTEMVLTLKSTNVNSKLERDCSKRLEGTSSRLASLPKAANPV